ncbi:hypothetical protein GCM10009117_15940 [Gangjinia marincola]|uniref:Peptidase M56 domain-containing protein n=1 Tax=Gangjinia marincola TaxID=578463 RepID=A0ABN1MGY8_9FLAO
MIAPYLIKSILCLLFLVAFYKVALENTPLHKFKRFFLLASLVFSFTIPLITITYTSNEVLLAKEITASTTYEIPSSGLTDNPKDPEKTLFPLEHMLWSIYGLGVVFFGIRFARNLYQIRQKINTGYTVKEHHYALSLLPKAVVPHSFLSWIFLSRKSYEENAIPPEVIAHEAAHVRQLHSLDILFVELLTVLFWFNPMVWIATSSVKLNHEFLADQEALKTASNSHTYQHLLLCHASGPHQTGLESPLNYSSLKKRILMLSHSFSRQKLIVRVSFLIPIIALCVYLFNEKIVAQPSAYDVSNAHILTARSINLKILDDTFYQVDNVIVKKDNLANFIASLHTDITKQDRDKIMNIHVTSNKEKTYDDLVYIQHVFSNYGYHRIVTPDEEIIRSKGNHSEIPSKLEKNSIQDKLIKINIENETIYLNGEKVAFKKFVKKVDALTKNWSAADFENFSFRVNTKNADRDFLNRLEAEFEKTQLYKKSGRSMLPPPPPPAPAAPAPIKNNSGYTPPPPPPPVSPIKSKKGNNDKASPEEVKFYNTLAKDLTVNPDIVIRQSVYEGFKDVYSRMTPQQKKSAEPYPKHKIIFASTQNNKFLPPPPPPPVPLKGSTNIAEKRYESNRKISGTVTIDGATYTSTSNLNGQVTYYNEDGSPLGAQEERKVKEQVEALKEKRARLFKKRDSIREEAEAKREELMEQREEAREEKKAQREELKERKEVIMAQREARRTQIMAQREQQTTTMTKRRQIIRERDDGVSFPLPPVPPEPLDLIVSMAKQNAVFFYNDKSITSDKAIDLIKNNESLNIHVKEFAKSNPVVNLSTKAFNLED